MDLALEGVFIAVMIGLIKCLNFLRKQVIGSEVKFPVPHRVDLKKKKSTSGQDLKIFVPGKLP